MSDGLPLGWLRRFCPHWFGWAYIPSRRRRFCRLCAHQQKLGGDGAYHDLSWFPEMRKR